ncbi:hypothetical protein ACJBU6_01543 [Exserohilum turcicum]
MPRPKPWVVHVVSSHLTGPRLPDTACLCQPLRKMGMPAPVNVYIARPVAASKGHHQTRHLVSGTMLGHAAPRHWHQPCHHVDCPPVVACLLTPSIRPHDGTITPPVPSRSPWS